ncbi:MAG TPA: MerC domain-containing protein [Planctomycetota bacterium]|nr:MerC domain-containing protein [Planctomycetota bacterium]
MTKQLDRVGVCASAACAVHCLLAPLVLLFVPALGSWWSHPAVHFVLALLVVPLALFVIFRACRCHRRTWVSVVASAGALLIVVSLAGEVAASDRAALVAAPLEAGGHAVQQEALHEAAHEGQHAEGCCLRIVEAPDGGKELQVTATTLLTILGSVLLVVAHAMNLRFAHGSAQEPALPH